MKNLFLVVIVVLSLFTISCSSNSQVKEETDIETKTSLESNTKLIIPYRNYNDIPVELVYYKEKERLSLRIAVTNNLSTDEALNFLKEEVIKIFLSSEDLKIENSSYIIKCYGGYPLWGPYCTTSIINDNYKYYQCLLFSENITFIDNCIYIRGSSKNSNYYPYTIQAPTVEKANFQKMVNFIEKNGFIVNESKDGTEYQYTFFDDNSNRHALITIKRDGETKKISVWAYYDGIKDQKHFFSYDIEKEKVNTMPNFQYEIIHGKAINKGYYDFLLHINN